MFTLPQIRQQLADHTPTVVTPKPTTRQAAVAIVVRDTHQGPEMLFIQRAQQKGDPWSGHMAFPGGHIEPEDGSFAATAMRETMEETGLDLRHDNYLGALDHQLAQPKGRVLDMLIAPHVFQIKGDPIFNPNYEVAEVVWAPLNAMADNSLHATETKPMAGAPTVFNGYKLARGHFIWGLTYRMLKTFFYTLDANWQPPRER